jgi:hypothetical protein
LFGKTVSCLSTMRYDVKIDGVALDDVEISETALDQCPWLRVNRSWSLWPGRCHRAFANL